jgi:hypothetical protein
MDQHKALLLGGGLVRIDRSSISYILPEPVVCAGGQLIGREAPAAGDRREASILLQRTTNRRSARLGLGGLGLYLGPGRYL